MLLSACYGQPCSIIFWYCHRCQHTFCTVNTVCAHPALSTLQAPQEFDVVHVDLSNKPRWYSRVNPRGLVPAVTWEGSTLLESLDICK